MEEFTNGSTKAGRYSSKRLLEEDDDKRFRGVAPRRFNADTSSTPETKRKHSTTIFLFRENDFPLMINLLTKEWGPASEPLGGMPEYHD